MARIVLFFASGSIAIFTYLLILIFALLYFGSVDEPPKAYTSYEQTAFSIALIEETKPKEMPKVSQKQAEKQIKEIPVKKENASKTANAGVEINDLFKQVESKVPVKSLKPPSKDDVIAKKKQAKKSSQNKVLENELEKILSNLDTQKTLSFALSKGEYDAFYAQVYEILARNWNPINTNIENFSEVEIIIDARGRFQYSIIKNSGNLEFDEALRRFLDIMRKQEFPPYQGGNQTKIKVTFKTEV